VASAATNAVTDAIIVCNWSGVKVCRYAAKARGPAMQPGTDVTRACCSSAGGGNGGGDKGGFSSAGGGNGGGDRDAAELEAAIVDERSGAGDAAPELEAASDEADETKLEAPADNKVFGAIEQASLQATAAQAAMPPVGGPIPPFFGMAACTGIS
jgi:hypothetical protein